MPGPTDPQDQIATLRASHDRLVALTADLDEETLSRPSYDPGWTVADVLSHLGSGAVIFGMRFDAGRNGTEAPGREAFQPIWDKWDAAAPTWQRDESAVAGEELVAMFEGLDATDRDSFAMDLFGSRHDLASFVGMRLSEHAIHSWDIAVALDPTARVPADAVALLLDRLPGLAAHTGKPVAEPFRVRVKTTDPALELVISLADTAGSTTIGPAADGEDYDGEITLPAEGYVRLVYGRLDEEHAPPIAETGSRGVADLRAAFPGL